MTNDLATLRRRYLVADAALARALDRAGAFSGPAAQLMLIKAYENARDAYAAYTAAMKGGAA